MPSKVEATAAGHAQGRRSARHTISAKIAPVSATANRGSTPQNDEPTRGSVEVVVSGILRGLYEGQFIPGQKLVENDLTERFGVGRGSVREALRRLEADGVISASYHRGASIRAFTRDEVQDLMDVKATLAGMAAREAAERLQNAEEASALIQCVMTLSASVEAGDAFAISRIRRQFWGEISKLANNQELMRLLLRHDQTLVRTQFHHAFDREGERQNAAYFQRIVDLILARNGAAADTAVRQHMRRSAAAIQRLPDDHFAQPRAPQKG
ncbi:MAG TPA: GntR family transcriptional regulator [Caulobacteraceae bacterium]|nr:GntR family transcriptional regulator [Caulobacteraceae bacterium]